MSKVFRILTDLEQEARGRTVYPADPRKGREGTPVSAQDLKDLLSSKAVGEKSKAFVNITIAEFERLEREFLELQEKQRMVLLRIRELLSDLEAAATGKAEEQEHFSPPGLDNMKARIYKDRKNE